MSRTNTPTPAAAPILPQQATTANYPPGGSTNGNQLPDFPRQWEFRSGFLGRRLFTDICFVCTGERDLEGFWQQLVKDGGWERHFTASRDAVMQITTVQGLVLVVDAAFITTTPPLPSVDYTSGKCYRALSISFLFCIIGLVSQLMFFGINRSLSHQISLLNPLSRAALISYFWLSLLPMYAFMISLYSLAFAFLSTLVKPVYVICMIITLIYALGSNSVHPNTYVILTFVFALILFVLGGVICILIPTPGK